MNFIDLAKQQRIIRKDIEKKICKVLDHGKYINGPEVQELEERLSAYAGTRYAVACASGTDALIMALMAYGIGPGDAIFVPAFTFIATAESIRLLGAVPVFVDIEAETFNIDVDKLEEGIERIKNGSGLTARGIIPVDLFGQTADYDRINAIAVKHGLFVIEDAAQSFGASYRERKSCSLADVAATSFFPAKPLGCYGDGGMIFTDREDIYEKLVSIRVHGKGRDKYDNIRIGLNGRLDTIQAAVLLEKLKIFDGEVELRQEIASYYSERLKDVYGTQYIMPFNVSVWAQYSLTHPGRDSITACLKEKGIPTAIYYPKPLHLQGAFEDLGYKRGDLPMSEAVAEKIFNLPMHPYLETGEQEIIVDALMEAVESRL